jgi:hypothetical protein
MPQPRNIGKMIVELIDNGTSLPTPKITFDPPGRMTPGWLHHHLMYMCSELHRAQTAVRTGQAFSRGNDAAVAALPRPAPLVNDPEDPRSMV